MLHVLTIGNFIADGLLITVAGVENTKLTTHFTLKDVLHIPKLCTNLISVTKLSQDFNCEVTFFHSHYEFQD